MNYQNDGREAIMPFARNEFVPFNSGPMEYDEETLEPKAKRARRDRASKMKKEEERKEEERKEEEEKGTIDEEKKKHRAVVEQDRRNSEEKSSTSTKSVWKRKGRNDDWFGQFRQSAWKACNYKKDLSEEYDKKARKKSKEYLQYHFCSSCHMKPLVENREYPLVSGYLWPCICVEKKKWGGMVMLESKSQDNLALIQRLENPSLKDNPHFDM
ncbi:hypothetical protein RFI_04990, partial [Reticulomyxa filosa]